MISLGRERILEEVRFENPCFTLNLLLLPIPQNNPSKHSSRNNKIYTSYIITRLTLQQTQAEQILVLVNFRHQMQNANISLHVRILFTGC